MTATSRPSRTLPDLTDAGTSGWPKSFTVWYDRDVGYMSIPFTWLLPKARKIIRQRDLYVKRWVVGGPAVKLIPEYLRDVAEYGTGDATVLQRVNAHATRTTIGCPRKCEFCGVKRIQPGFRELDDWPDLPIVCDDNLLAASHRHVERVIERLRKWSGCDFNQGLDARLLDSRHAELLATLKKPVIRLALDSDACKQPWADAVERLRTAGVPKGRIRSYVLCGFQGCRENDIARCEYVESFGLKALPMWHHSLTALRFNEIRPDQAAMGWTARERRKLFCWYYWHRTLETRG
jgi:hypothetical protein